jgi:hypothetical protein
MRAGAVDRREFEQAEPGVELVRLRILAGLEMRLGDLELRGAGQQLVAVETVTRELQGRVDDAVEAGEREFVDAETAQGAAEVEEGVRRAFVGGIFLQEALVDRGGLRQSGRPACGACGPARAGPT